MTGFWRGIRCANPIPMGLVDRALDVTDPAKFASRCRMLLRACGDRPILPPRTVHDPKATTAPPNLPGARQFRQWLSSPERNRYPREEEVRGAKRLEFLTLRVAHFRVRGWDVERAEAERLAAQNALIEGIASFAFNVVALYKGPRVSNEDLVQECMLGAYSAIRKYDWRQGFRLLTYANNWFHCACHSLIYQTSRTVRITPQVQKMLKRLGDARERHGDDPATIEKITGISESAQQSLDQVVTGTISLSQSSESDEDDGFTENSMPSSPSASDDVERHHRIADLRTAMENIAPMSRQILGMLWGVDQDDGEPMTHAQVAGVLKLRPTTVRMLERQCLDELARELRLVQQSLDD